MNKILGSIFTNIFLKVSFLDLFVSICVILFLIWVAYEVVSLFHD